MSLKIMSTNFQEEEELDGGLKMRALFTFTVRISVGRKRSDVVVCDEGIAPAMSEEQNATDDPFAVDRKLTAKVNKAKMRRSTLLSIRVITLSIILDMAIDI